MNLKLMRSLLVAAILSAGLLASLRSLPATAQSGPDRATAMGVIDGTVRGPDGAPLAGIEIALFHIAPTGEWQTLTYTTATDAAGHYRVESLAPGIYRTGFRDRTHRYGQQYFSASVTFAGATSITINGNTVVGVDAQLVEAGGIAGQVHNPQAPGDPIGVFTKAGAEWQLVQGIAAAEISDPLALGQYEALDLPPAIYRVCAYTITVGPTPITGPCYDRISAGVASATDVTVTAGVLVRGVDVTDQELRDLASIGGALRDEAGTPLAGIQATAYQLTGEWLNEWKARQTALTDAGGVYLLTGLVPDTYLIYFGDPQGAYIGRYYGGVSDRNNARPVTVGPLEQRTGADERLALGGLISGAVTIAGQTPAPTATVYASPATEPWWVWRYAGEYDAERATYQIGGLPPGVYRVRAAASDYLNSFQWYTAYYGDVQDADLATPITITAGSRVGGIDINVAQGAFDGVLAGTVSDENRRPLPDIRVELLYREWHNWDTPPLLYTTTDNAGHYHFEGLTDGAYHVRYLDPAGIYVRSYYHNRSNSWPIPDDVLVEGGFSGGFIDQQMVKAGTIQGTIRNSAGKPVTGAVVGYRTELDSFYPVRTVTTDADGQYKITGVAPGIYWVCAAFPFVPLRSGTCFGGSSDYLSGLPVTVGAGTETSGINIVLGAQAEWQRLYLPLMQQAEQR